MKTHLNLLPLRYRQRQLIRLRLRQWSVVWAFVIVAAGGTGWSHWSRYRAGAARLASLQREYAPLKRMDEEVKTITEQIQQLQQRESLVLQLGDEQSMLALIGLLSRAAKQCDGQVGIQRLQFQRQWQSQGEGKGRNAKVLILEGMAADNHSVAQFAAVLRQTNGFDRVELKSTGTLAAPTGEARTYRLECVF